MNVFELFGTIAIDHSEAERGLDKTVRHARETESALEKTFKRIGGYVAAAFSVSAVVNFGKTCTQVFASVAAEESAFAQIMGDYADTATEKLNAVADQTGITSTRMTGAMNSMTAKFMGLGYSVEDATTLASDGLLIAADAAAFWDMSMDESVAHLNSFINGSYEGGEAIGLFANDTQMAAYAVEKGIIADAKAWGTLDEATKQATRLDYAKNMQQQSGVTGQAAKEAGAYANVMANLQEAWRQFQAVIGKPILERFVLPGMKMLNEFMPVLTESVSNGIDWLTEGFDKIAVYFSDVFTEDGLNLDALPKALKKMFRDLGSSVSGLLRSFGRSVKNGWNNTVWPMIQKVFKAVFGVELPDWEEVKRQISDGWNNTVWPAIQNFFTKSFGITLPDWPTLKQNISDGWDTIKTAVAKFFENPLEVVLPVWNDLKTKISDGWTKTVWPAIKDFFANPFEIILPAWENLKTSISDGWTKTVWPAIKDFFTKPFGITMPTWSELKTSIETGWTEMVWPAIKDFFTKPFGITMPSWEELKTNISNGWNDTVWPAIKDFFTKPFDITMPMWETVKKTIVDGWDSIKEQVGEAVNIDLSNVNIAGVFTAAETAIANVIEAAKTFYNDIVNALSLDENGKIKLDETLSGLFDAGVTAIANLLGSASTLVADIVGAITGNEEDANKIGEVFSDLFGWAGEIVSGVKDNALAVFDWFLNNGDALSGIITALALSTGMFVLANPAILAIGALIALIGIMSTDWENFESNYPQLVDAFESLTGLDFTDVADSLSKFQEGVKGIFEYLATHKTELSLLLAAFGGLAMYTGHPVAGVALLSASGFMAEENAVEKNASNLLKGEATAKKEAYDAAVATGRPEIIMSVLTTTLDGAPEIPDRTQNRNRDDGGSNADTIRFDPENYIPNTMGVQSLLTMMQTWTGQIKTDVTAAVREGMSGVTITANVDTGNITLNDGTLVGALAPRINMVLGAFNQRSGRG